MCVGLETDKYNAKVPFELGKTARPGKKIRMESAVRDIHISAHV